MVDRSQASKSGRGDAKAHDVHFGRNQPIPSEAAMFQPEELKKNKPLLWSPGNGEDVWGLFCACASGDLETVKQVLGKDPSLVRSHHEYRTPLYFAVRENQMAVVTYLLKQGANPFYNGEDLIDMARIRRLPEIEALLESKRAASLKVLSPVQELLQAIRFRDFATLGRLMDGLMSPSSSCDIWTAAFAGNISRVRDLLDSDPSLVNRMGEDRSGTPLVHASGRGHLEIVRLLLERGADPNVPEPGNAPHGRALYSAVYGRHFEVAKLLLEHGANPNQEVESSADAPSIAIMNSDAKTIELLASYGGHWRIPVQLADS
jgi:ankyrin repeat protein